MGQLMSMISSLIAVLSPIFHWAISKRKNTLIIQSWYDKEGYVRLENICEKTVILKKISRQRNCCIKDFCYGHVIEPGKGFRIYFKSFDDSKNVISFKIHLGVTDEIDRVCTILRKKRKWIVK